MERSLRTNIEIDDDLLIPLALRIANMGRRMLGFGRGRQAPCESSHQRRPDFTVHGHLLKPPHCSNLSTIPNYLGASL